MYKTKNILTILFLILLTSCEEPLELDGKWIISKMTYKGEEVYPSTISKKTRIIVNIDGYDGAERIYFKVQDSTITFPGFNSDKIVANFQINEKKLKTAIKNSNQIKDSLLSNTGNIFLQDYEIINLKHRFKIGLKSPKTKMIIIKESYLIKQQINNRLVSF